jgi:hypothetical protein
MVTSATTNGLSLHRRQKAWHEMFVLAFKIAKFNL